MENRLGSVIKFYRIKKSLTQQELSEGICTPSYLSRIENNQVIPDRSIINLLYNKLDILKNDNGQRYSEIDDRIETWYGNMIERKEHQENVYELMELAEGIDNEVMIKFNLVYSRYLLENRKFEKAGKHLNTIGSILTPGENRTFFLYSTIIMSYLYLREDYEEALHKGLKLLAIKDYNQLGSKMELGMLYYNISLNYSRLYRNERSIHFSKMALKIFNNNYFFDRAINCHILLGISYNRLGFWDESLNSHQLTQKLINHIPKRDQLSYKSLLHNNMGYCYELQGKYMEAITYYKKGLELKTDSANKFRTIVNLIRVTTAIDEKESARQWVQIGMDILNEHSPLKYKYQIYIYSLLLGDEDSDLDYILDLQTRSIQYFIDNKSWKCVYDYTKIFAQIYEERFYYKKANSMYKLALEACNRLISMRGGEKFEESNNRYTNHYRNHPVNM